MRKFIFSAAVIAVVSLGMMGCNNGAYDSNPDADNNGTINPLNPTGGMDESFSWGGTDPMSAEVNGNAWKADFGSIIEQNGKMYIGGSNVGSSSSCTFELVPPLSADQVIEINWSATGNLATYVPNTADPNVSYNSNFAGKGQVKILEADASHVKGLFYFLAKNPNTGHYINIQKGYFNINK